MPNRTEPAVPAPFSSGPFHVRPDWIDENGHVNLAYYVMLFDWATDALWHPIGLGDGFRAGGMGTFAAESHILYRAELLAGDSVLVMSQIVALDPKRLHVAHEMRRLRDGVVSAQQELMYLSVSLTTRRVAPWPEATFARLSEAAAAHADLARPGWLGRRIGVG